MFLNATARPMPVRVACSAVRLGGFCQPASVCFQPAARAHCSVTSTRPTPPGSGVPIAVRLSSRSRFFKRSSTGSIPSS